MSLFLVIVGLDPKVPPSGADMQPRAQADGLGISRINQQEGTAGFSLEYLQRAKDLQRVRVAAPGERMREHRKIRDGAKIMLLTR